MTAGGPGRTSAAPAVSVDVRRTGPDGAVEELRWSTGEVVISRFDPTGALVSRRTVRIGSTGDVIVDDDGPAAPQTPPASLPVESSTNVYGASVERTQLGGGLVVEKTFDDDGGLRAVRLHGPWGEDALALEPDGSLARSWRFGAHGRQTWDAGGRCVEENVTWGR